MRSRVTEGSRPSASATLAFGSDVITSAGSTWRMLSAMRVRLMDSASPRGRSAVTMICSLAEADLHAGFDVLISPAVTATSVSKGSKPT